jgi:hypothetical protein
MTLTISKLQSSAPLPFMVRTEDDTLVGTFATEQEAEQFVATHTVPMFPEIEIEIDLTGPDGNAFYILGAVTQALRSAGATKEQTTTFNNDATGGDYDNLLQVVARWVNLDAY